jgi:prolipoprotein diacylglyceryl transferase
MAWFQTLDFIAPCVPTGLMFGRIGNFIGGELYGRQVTDPNFALGMIFPTDPLQLVRHPSQLYQALCEGLILFIVLWWFSSKPRPRMAVSAVFLTGYGLARFIVEFFREPDNGQLFIGWMSKGQFLSLPMILIGLWMLWYAYQKKVYDWGPQKNNG